MISFYRFLQSTKPELKIVCQYFDCKLKIFYGGIPYTVYSVYYTVYLPYDTILNSRSHDGFGATEGQKWRK